jgi:uncharacterized protein (DUF58 family)
MKRRDGTTDEQLTRVTASPATSSPAAPAWAQGRGVGIDPQALMRIKSLELRAKVIVEGFLTGLHRSPYHGFSVEFSEYRQYTEGDDPRYLDWKLYARSDRYFIKRYEDETNLRCHLLIDMSRSMSYGSTGYTKAQYAGTLAATIGYFLSLQRDAVGLVTFDDRIREVLPPRYRPGHFRRLLVALDQPVVGTATDLKLPLERVAEMVTRRGMFVLVSDLLASLDGLEQKLGYLRSRGHDVFLCHVLDPAELSFDFAKPALFEDIESGRDVYVDPDTLRLHYLRRIAAHNQAVQTICDNLGIDYHRFATDRPLELALFDFLCARMRLKRAALRRRAQRRNYGGSAGRDKE